MDRALPPPGRGALPPPRRRPAVDARRRRAHHPMITSDRSATMTSHHETKIVADPNVPLVRITREFDASPDKVFRAHTDPQLVVQWLGPNARQMRVDYWDCRSGGS